MNSKEINYQFAISILRLKIDEIVDELRNKQDQESLLLKKELDKAIIWLIKGEEHNIDPNKEILILPEVRTQTPSSEFRIIEDHESDKALNWTEIEIGNKKIRPSPGSWLILN
ncbi:hypothetical protein [Leptospira alstonii]|uniref:hypothetical protein n=1 Tax=Leptospira alstonii TaxID=28452 RepID=UPI000773EB17|nr:hypothetical protein [Leptospira alstonii]